MNSMQEFFKRIRIRPFVYTGMLLLSLVLSAIEAYNPVIRKFGSFKHILNYNYIETLSGWTSKIGAFFDDGKAFVFILLGILGILAFSALVAVFLSGYVNVFIASVEDKAKTKGEFVTGIKRNFLKTFLYIFTAIVMTIPFAFMILYSAIPTVFMIKLLLDGDTGVIFTMLLMALLTVIVVLFAILFYGMYFSYVLPSIAGLRRKTAHSGIKMTNMYAWYLLPKTALFLFVAALIRVLLFVVHYGHSSVALSLILLAITAILRSFLYYVYFYFVFTTFIAMRDDLYPDYKEDIPEPKKHIARVPQQRIVKEETEPLKEETSDTENDDYDDSFEP